MNLYFAPLEGITTCIYRNTHFEMFGGCDAYYAPFVTPCDNEKNSSKNVRDILPERNKPKLMVQVLTNQADYLIKFTEKIKRLGYDEINLNMGCPASTVVKKGRGAGFLREPEQLDRFLYEVFSGCDMKFSVKTRIGFYSGEEMDVLSDIYNKYPLTRLIIHPRVREEYYKGVPDNRFFEKAYNRSKHKVCYSGNVFSAEDYTSLVNRFPNMEGVMIGRGAIANPAIFREIRGGKKLCREDIVGFTKRLSENYYNVLGSETFTLHKLKEIWSYMSWNYPEEKKLIKTMKKSTKLADFMSAVNNLPEI